VWNVDHIFPFDAWCLDDPQEFKACMYYKNLQPMTRSENSEKHTKYDGEAKDAYWQSFVALDEARKHDRWHRIHSAFESFLENTMRL
jgi:hypothetical protein